MDEEITFALSQEEEELTELFVEHDMWPAGDIEEHVVIKKDNKILAGAMLVQTSSNVFHLAVFAVKKGSQNKGTGSKFLQQLLKNPWEYCKNRHEKSNKIFLVTTAAKGRSAGFYKQNGFVACEFTAFASPYDKQCSECPDETACNPVAMIYMS